MCDVDENKISRGSFDCFENRVVTARVPIIHFTAARPLVIICMKLGLTEGGFEQNLASTGWQEGVDFFHFGL